MKYVLLGSLSDKWATKQGYGRIRSMPAFDEKAMSTALKKV